MNAYIGVDCGSTVTKAVAFSSQMSLKAVAAERVPLQLGADGRVERDAEELWKSVLRVVAQIAKSVDGEILGIGVTGHGDGGYLIDARGEPVRPGILSLDGRADADLQRWMTPESTDAALALTGQIPFGASPAILLRWLSEHEPDVLGSSRWFVSAKDYVKFRMTGVCVTDPTEASASFTDVRTQMYSEDAFELYGLDAVRHLVPPVADSIAIVARLRDEVSDHLGVRRGIPVINGVHDVDASAIGTGSLGLGVATLIAGSYSINEVLSDQPVLSDRWMCRNAPQPGRWLSMAVSPTSASTLEWWVERVLAPFGHMASQAAWESLADLLSQPLPTDAPIFIPHLYRTGVEDGGSFYRIRAHHGTREMVTAVCRGVCFAHRAHLDDLSAAFRVERVVVTGGATRSDEWSREFANVLNRPIDVPLVAETGARGAAMVAAVGAGEYQSIDEVQLAFAPECRRFDPDPERADHADEQFQFYRRAVSI